MDYCIINGLLCPVQSAVVSIQDRGFRYGDGVFETIAVHGGVPWQYELHMKRLAAGLQAIRINFDVTTLQDDCRILLEKNNLGVGILRIEITRGSASQGYLPKAGKPTIVIETSEFSALPEFPVPLWKSAWCKISPRALPVQYKLCQGLNSTLARMEAASHQCFDALLFNERGHVCETSSGNIFWFKEGILYTPALSCGILEGTTRAAILRLSSYPVKEVEAPLETLLAAEAVFITNTVWKAVAVKTILPCTSSFDSKALADAMRNILEKDTVRHAEAWRSHWQ